MKKLVYLFMALGLMLTSCDPMDDIYEAIDAQEEIISGEVSITLSDEDYEELELSYGNFSSIDDAKTMIPGLLTDKYPVWGEGSLVNVTFNLYDPIYVESYTVTSADYEALLDAGDIQGAHLSNNNAINAFMAYKDSQAEQGSYIELTYNKLAEKISYTLTDDDYASVGNGSYDNFDIRTGKNEEDIEVRREKIETILLANFPDTPINQQYLVSYQAFNNSYKTVTLEMLVQFDGTNYNMVSGTEYTLNGDDTDLIGAELLETYPGPAGNLASYGSFERRSGHDNYWSDDMLLEAIDIALQNNFPTAATGDKYSVQLEAYLGSGTYETLTILVELLDSGSYGKLPDTLIEETNVFALTDKWDVPFTLTADDYTAMGQSYPNFSDEELAWYRIAIYLESAFPYAEAEDMTAVSYDLYSGSVETEYVNFVFDGDKWIGTPSVVAKTIKFGNDGSMWVPDNTIKYTLTSADYELVGNGYYGNFDVRSGKAEETEEVRLEKINTILLNNFPAMEEGQKYAVTYNVYSGANEVWEMKVVLTSGEYVLQ
ncbi:hypothetical protein SAMN05444411_11326 [Lutibacter oricola]|uniref:DUF5017 domain-containing protein n=1 Tax=Lutibacter oricola TaxID=762486 RepID=A0A1H3G477_9FLAO|nr:hypothetical protein [Lutibacter oricola]SDX97508.1 hypothetical protein SAMN05444411_11326 [Lutibacter oricola]